MLKELKVVSSFSEKAVVNKVTSETTLKHELGSFFWICGYLLQAQIQRPHYNTLMLPSSHPAACSRVEGNYEK